MELKVPPAGESISTVMISEWLVAEGESVSADQILVVLETDKINVEVPSPVDGTLVKILKQPGEDAEIGEVIAELAAGAGGKAPAAKEATPSKDESAAKDHSAGKNAPAKEEPIVSPAARRVLEEKGLDAASVQ